MTRAAEPPPLTGTRLGSFVDWLADRDLVRASSYGELHTWSVEQLELFWRAIWDHFDVQADGDPAVALASRVMPGAKWFPHVRLNYAEHATRPVRDGVVPGRAPALVAHSQTRAARTLSWDELDREVARVQAGLRELGVGPGDRVVAYLPNIPETVVAFLATASLGAVWASCAPEFGARSVIDRFAQVAPTVMLTVTGYVYGDKHVDRTDEAVAIASSLPSLRAVVHVPYGDEVGAAPTSDMVGWDSLGATSRPGPATYERVPFDHPLVVLFSSGTTGVPKAIVHGHGGILLEHLKNHALSWDLRPGDTMLWFSTTAWMMWNALVSGLLHGTTLVLIDGNPVHPDLGWQWSLAAESGATLVGASPGYLMACRKAGLRPAHDHDLSSLRQVGAAGSPLPLEGYAWVADELGEHVLLNVGSGGTDVCSGLVQGSPWQPVVPGEIAGPCLGVAVHAYDESGDDVAPGELGELVITEPMPSMPVGLWGDSDGSRLAETYFGTYRGVWRHGDWIRISASGSCVIAGRSDATLNRGGVRLGTSEFYGVVEELPTIADSLVVHLEDPAGGNGELVLFVQLEPGGRLTEELRAVIRRVLRSQLSPRHVPDTIEEVPTVPRNRTGKKLEVPAKRVLLGADLDEVASREVLADPTSMDRIVEYARARA